MEPTTIQEDIVSKRKRAPPTPVKPSTSELQNYTPNPKPRKQSRKTTPIPPYEPPADIFTPPREVFISTAPTKSAPKRKGSVRPTKARTKGKELAHVQVKQEIPDDIDLLAPMPPPSPTDDPLLLSGPPEFELLSELWDGGMTPAYEDLPPSSPVVPLDADVEPVRFFDFDAGGADDAWSDSDNEEEGEGEFTGKWRMMRGRTKQDPPSSATRTRQERWGRPISPFPGIKELSLLREEEEEEEVRQLSTEPEPEGSQHDESSDTADEPSLVKITSADPWAAARAVAFLQQHDYDCYTKLTKKRGVSQSPLVDLAKAGRQRRRSTMSVISDETTTPSITIPKQYPAGPRKWTKEDWKLLDACFTDQRINPSGSLDMLAPVDAVALEAVVVRFIDMIGGQTLVNTFGESWTSDNLFERTRALLKKQRSGNVAPPTTPMSSYSFSSPFAANHNANHFLRSMDVPDFSPINFGFNSDKSVRHRSTQQTSVIDDSLFYETEGGALPPASLAPRYSYLFEEDAAINDTGPSEDNISASGEMQISSTPYVCSPHFPESNIEEVFWDQDLCSVAQDLSPQRPDSVPVSNNLGSRVRGFFSSYLPILSKTSSLKRSHVHQKPSLPLPPPSVLEKPRGPVETPARPLIPRAPHPRELVHLNHISLKPSNIPRAKPVPKRLVELAPVPHAVIKPDPTSRDRVVPRPRRSSGSSVKDLVRGFEQMEYSTDRRIAGVGNTMNSKRGKLDLRPTWKP